jgi:hypothetical protein
MRGLIVVRARQDAPAEALLLNHQERLSPVGMCLLSDMTPHCTEYFWREKESGWCQKMPPHSTITRK